MSQISYYTPLDDDLHAAFGEEDVGLDEFSGQSAEPDDYRIYSHGFSLRVELTCATDIAQAALARLGWDSRDWRASNSKGAERWSLRGTTFLTQRRPRNERLPLTRRNKEWKTRLYSVQVERRQGKVLLDLHGVRRPDVERLLERIMLLGPADYAIKYFRAAERYFVLPPYEAFRLGAALGAVPHNGAGRISKKAFLACDVRFPVRVKTRSRRMATLSIYRVRGGATAAFKVELRLAGKSRDRGTFQEEDIERLDEVLLRLIAEHDLRPIAKPARWEPCGRASPARDGQLERLGAAAYRGRQASRELLETALKCHTPTILLFGETREDTVTSVGLPYIRQDSSPSSSSSATPASPVAFDESTGGALIQEDQDRIEAELVEVALGEPIGAASIAPISPNADGLEDLEHSRVKAISVHEEPSATRSTSDEPRGPAPTYRPDRDQNLWDSVAKDINAYEGFLSEVVLDAQQDPMPLVRALDRARPGTVALHALCPMTSEGHARTWGTVSSAMSVYPGTPETKTLVLVVDVEVLCAGIDAVDLFDEETGRNIPGPLLHANWLWDTTPLLIKATSGWIWPMLEELREICERTAMRIVLVTVDARPDHGYGELRRSHFFRDARVRSHIGDAGRYWCHTRYRVETGRGSRPRRVVMIKDEGEGLMGRIIHGRPAALPRPYTYGLSRVR